MMKWRNQISIFKALRYVFDKWTALERGCFSELNATKIQLKDKLKLVVLFSRWQILFTNSSGRFFYETSLAYKTLSNLWIVVSRPKTWEELLNFLFRYLVCIWEDTKDKIWCGLNSFLMKTAIHLLSNVGFGFGLTCLKNNWVACDQSWLFDMLVVSIFQKWNCAASICDCVPMVW